MTTFASLKFNTAVADFKKLFGGHTQMFRYGQFYVTGITIDGMLSVIDSELQANIRFIVDPLAYKNTMTYFRTKLSVDVADISVSVIMALLNSIEVDHDMAVIRALFRSIVTKDDAADARRDFNQLWSDDHLPSAPYWSGSSPSLAKALAARALEKDRCYQVSTSMVSKLAKARGTAPLPAAAAVSASELAGAKVVETVAPQPTVFDTGQQVVRHANPAGLSVAYTQMKKTIDAGGYVHCGVVSGARGPFPRPEHYVLAFAYDTIDGRDAFLFWDPDANHSNIASTAPAPGAAGWGPGFGVLFASPTRLSTAIDDADLTAIDRTSNSSTFGDHTIETRRHCYQVFYVQSLPIAKRVKVHTKVVAPPKHASLDSMLHNAVTLYATYGVEVLEVSREDVTEEPEADLAQFSTLYCGFGDQPSSEMVDLHALARSADRGFGVTPDDTDVVITLVGDLVPAALGTPKSSQAKPGIVISSGATEWTLAHELGHVLGLDDVIDPAHLMHTSTAAFAADPPVLTAADVAAIALSPWVAEG
jgi:hypothetical protein